MPREEKGAREDERERESRAEIGVGNGGEANATSLVLRFVTARCEWAPVLLTEPWPSDNEWTVEAGSCDVVWSNVKAVGRVPERARPSIVQYRCASWLADDVDSSSG
jgi:hypothetical protein